MNPFRLVPIALTFTFLGVGCAGEAGAPALASPRASAGASGRNPVTGQSASPGSMTAGAPVATQAAGSAAESGGVPDGYVGSAGEAGAPGEGAGAAGGGGVAVGGAAGSMASQTGKGGTAGTSGNAGAKAGAAGEGVPRAGAGSVDPFAAEVAPVTSGSLWSLSFGEASFVVDASQGANVTTFSLGGHNVLADSSHFRASPQKTWSWPPPPEITSLAYSPSRNGNVMVMEGQTSQKWGLKARKRYWANAAHQVVTLEYTLTNTGTVTASWAPWEVSRLQGTGLTFYPEGSAIPAKPASYGQGLPLTTTGGISWLDYQPAKFPSVGGGNTNYIVARDGREGWAAHVESGLLFLKSFEDVPVSQLAPDEGEVQLWTDSTHALMEMENEGAYLPLAPGQSQVWTMRWYLRRLPTDVAATAGNVKLVEFARGQVLK